MPDRLLFVLGAALAFSAPSSAQLVVPQFFVVDHAQATALVRNGGATPQVIASFVVEEPAVSSLRIHFDEVLLAGNPFDGTGSVVRMTSLLDGHQQVMNAAQLQEWEQGSAWFNGPAVQVDLIANPGTGDNRLSVDRVEVGIPLGAWESQCGPTDDRVPSNDPRVARLLPSGCTAWMINDCAKCFLSAGHCGSSNNMVEFNVPFSTSNGSWVHPPPSDQYSIESASKQITNGGLGNDWFYFGTVTNPSSGLTAFAAQGDAFDLLAPPALAGNTIRITGHGTDNTPNSTYNQIQQTHVGPFTSNGLVLQYQADTTGGNSGSPVIWEQMNVAIGIHTNAGCSTGGGGSNQGTSILASALQAALANPTGVCGSAGIGGAFGDLGNSLVQPPWSVPPRLTACGALTAGTPYEIVLSYETLVNTTSTAFVVVGGQNVSLSFKGGVLVPSPDVIVPIALNTAFGAPSSLTFGGLWSGALPVGTTVYAQVWIDVQSVFFDVVMASNGLSLTAQ